MLKYGVQYLMSDATPNQTRAINALRCMLSNIGENTWNFIASAYWTVAIFGKEKEVIPYLSQGYEHICTCQEDAHNLTKMLGASAQSTEMIKGCSENVSNMKIEMEKKKAEYVVKR